MKLSILAIATSFAALFGSSFCNAQTTITFEELPLGGSGFYNGVTTTPATTQWISQGVSFSNNHYPWGFDGWAYSNHTDTTTKGVENQYSAFTGGGSTGGGGVAPGQTYAIAYGNEDVARFTLPSISLLNSVDITNTTYAALSMRDGDSFAKKFGGSTGADPDFFEVIFRGYEGVNGTGRLTGEVKVALADFRSANSSDDYILNRWLNVDLTMLSEVRSVSLEFTSSDVGRFGINTPLYVAMDNLTFTAVPEPTSLALCGAIAAAGWGWRRVRKRTSTGTFSR